VKRALAILAASAALFAATRALGAAPSPVVMPKPVIPIEFSHGAHLKLGMKCLSCHDATVKSIDAADDLLPKMKLCVTCHRLDAPDPAKAFPKSSCDTCHPGFTRDPEHPEVKPAEVVLPAPRLRFTHRAHSLLGIVCGDCHGDMTKQTAPSRGGWGEHIPTMAKCLECHNGEAAPNACTTCHLAEDDGRLLTAYPEGRLQPTGRFRDDDHRDPAWNYRHGLAARDEEYCQSCHTPKDCLSCHDGADKPRDIHPGNYVALHARDAMVRSAECLGCHEGGVDCQKCHETTGVTQASTTDGKDPKPVTGRIHPDGWADFGAGRNLHADIARTSIESCASCHTEEECITCHSDRTLRINPHPPGFKASLLQGRNDAVCLKCHDTIPR
jgi:hypothetical protein